MLVGQEENIPEWMQKKQVQYAIEEAESEAKLQRRVAAKLFIQAEAPKFWEQLLDKLQLAVSALPHLKVDGSLSKTENHVRISMRMPDLFLNETFTDLLLDEERIRATTLGDGTYNLDFIVLRENQLAVITSGVGKTMNAGQAHEYIMERMLLLLERRKAQHRPY